MHVDCACVPKHGCGCVDVVYVCVHACDGVCGCCSMLCVLCVCPCVPERVGPWHACHMAEIREEWGRDGWGGWLAGRQGCISPGDRLAREAAPGPVTHSLEEFKEARWREVSAIAGFREIRSFCSDN